MAIPDYHYHLQFYVHNKAQMYLPRQDGAFGSFYFFKKLPPYNVLTYDNYLLERTHVKTLNTQNQRCDEENSGVDTTTCITKYLEQTVGCSMGLHGTDPDLKR